LDLDIERAAGLGGVTGGDRTIGGLA
jgi:hypothetical protein